MRGSPVIGRAQGRRWGPCLRQRRPWRPYGRSCDGGGARGRVPHLTPREHRVEDDNQFAHAGDQRDFGLFALSAQPFVIGHDNRIVAGRGAEGRHIEQGADVSAPALDMALASMLTAVVVVRRDTDQPGGGFITDAAKLRQPSERAGDEVIAEPGTLAMIARRARNCAFAAILASIAASSLASWALIVLRIARWAFSTTRGCPCSPSCRIGVASLTSRLRAVTSRLSASRSASWAGSAATAKVSANQAIISASIGSFLAKRPADLAK